jgi:predicted dehydrogenase
MRFVPELAELRRRIQSGGLGDVLSVACWMWDAEPPSREYLRTSGGMALDMGVHEIDRTRWLVGQDFEYIAAVAAQPTGAAEFVDEPAAAQVIGSLSGGATASISLGRRFERGDCAWSEVMGTNGYARSTFLWGEEGQHVLAEAVHAQAEVFAQSVRTGAVLDGAASAENAINTVTTAERVREALRRTSGGHL